MSAFYSDISDYILIQSNFAKGMRNATIVRNIDATTLGGEMDASYAISGRLKLTGTLAYTLGENNTDGRPLAQMPPLELRMGLEYSDAVWSAGLLTRVVAAQERVALDQGNIVGQDLGPTGGFAVISLNGGWRPVANTLVTVGVDNLFDRTCAEHLSRGGAMVWIAWKKARPSCPVIARAAIVVLGDDGEVGCGEIARAEQVLCGPRK